MNNLTTLLELAFKSDGTMFTSIVLLLIICIFTYALLNSLFVNLFKGLFSRPKTKTVIKKIYVDTDGDEIEQ